MNYDEYFQKTMGWVEDSLKQETETIDYDKLTQKQKQVIFNDWYEKWNDHDCKLAWKGACDFCHTFWELCQKLEMKCPVEFI